MLCAFRVYVPKKLSMQSLYSLRRGEMDSVARSMRDEVDRLHSSKALPPSGADTPHLTHWHLLATYFNCDEKVSVAAEAYKGLLRIACDDALLRRLAKHPNADDECAYKVARRVG